MILSLALLLALLLPPPAAPATVIPGQQFSVVKKAAVRSGASLDSPAVGSLAIGEIIEVLEVGAAPGTGAVRVRVALGWTSVTSKSGVQLLAPVSAPSTAAVADAAESHSHQSEACPVLASLEPAEPCKPCPAAQGSGGRLGKARGAMSCQFCSFALSPAPPPHVCKHTVAPQVSPGSSQCAGRSSGARIALADEPVDPPLLAHSPNRLQLFLAKRHCMKRHGRATHRDSSVKPS